MTPLEVLKKVFGYDNFRPYQEDIINAVLEGRDCLAVLSTSAGKSITYQIPAIILDGTAVIISPLIALMQDQAEEMNSRGIKARFYNSSLTIKQKEKVREELLAGDIKLLFMAPETLQGLDLSEMVPKVSMVSADEVHSISSEGMDFRPSYRYILPFLGDLASKIPILGLTATANKFVRDDVVKNLGLNNPYIVVGNPDRPEITLRVVDAGNKDSWLRNNLVPVCKKALTSGSAMVYIQNRKKVDSYAAELKKAIPHRTIIGNHAGHTAKQRKDTLKAFLEDDNSVSVSSSALGLGINKAQPLDSKVLTPEGFVKIRDLEVGQKIFNAKGKVHEVTHLHPIQKSQQYRLNFSDGTSCISSPDHLWNVGTSKNVTGGQPFKNLSTKQISDNLLLGSGRCRFRVPLPEAIDFPEKSFKVHPYVVGALIGDGCITQGLVSISSADKWIVDKIISLVDASITPKQYSEYTWGLTTPRGQENPLLNGLRGIGLFGKNSNDKFIPAEYLLGSLEQRVHLFQGLMDTDGFIFKCGTSGVYVTNSKLLSEDVSTLVRSLGGIVSIKKVLKSYRVTVRLPNTHWLASVPRKVRFIKERQKYQPLKQIESIDILPEEVDMRCITTSSDDGLYITDDFTVTHNCNVRTMIIIGTPKTCVELLQMYGRCARDGLPSTAIIVVDPYRDFSQNEYFLRESTASEEHKAKVRREYKIVAKILTPNRDSAHIRKDLVEYFK